MKKSQLVTQVILSSNPTFGHSEAIRLFVHEFLEHFPEKNFHEWDSEVAPHIARTYLLTLESAKCNKIKYLVDELELLCQKMK